MVDDTTPKPATPAKPTGRKATASRPSPAKVAGSKAEKAKPSTAKKATSKKPVSEKKLVATPVKRPAKVLKKPANTAVTSAKGDSGTARKAASRWPAIAGGAVAAVAAAGAAVFALRKSKVNETIVAKADSADGVGDETQE